MRCEDFLDQYHIPEKQDIPDDYDGISVEFVDYGFVSIYRIADLSAVAEMFRYTKVNRVNKQTPEPEAKPASGSFFAIRNTYHTQ